MYKIPKHKNELQLADKEAENILFSNVVQIIEKRKQLGEDFVIGKILNFVYFCNL